MEEHFSLRKDYCSEATARRGGQINAKLLPRISGKCPKREQRTEIWKLEERQD